MTDIKLSNLASYRLNHFFYKRIYNSTYIFYTCYAQIEKCQTHIWINNGLFIVDRNYGFMINFTILGKGVCTSERMLVNKYDILAKQNFE